MQHIMGLERRDSKHSIHFRDDLSEYSNPACWGESPGPLSLSDHRLVPEGLQVRRTVGEALLRVQWQRQRDGTNETCADSCSCLGQRVVSSTIGVEDKPARSTAWTFWGTRTPPPRQPVLFTWSEVQSIILLPSEDKGPYLIAITTLRPREVATREWLLQAGNLRGRARWGIEMTATIIRERSAAAPRGNGPACGCCGTGRLLGLSLALFMDSARVACEVARLQPSAEAMERLIEVLDMLMECHGACQSTLGTETAQPLLPAAHFPLAALKRFCDATRGAYAAFTEWRQWREVSKLVRAPLELDDKVWTGHV
eukprot:gnl/TRDRNA2_/TRDRNA2_154614_c0_seq1.p1 gnl/TRDRNA2_/TRDRNA2_154614_c0~~gnl/TRDRNA2_/TRDRNA2_154614_c0_seq1.p1  ORF type:complete len:312 (+),score=48.45 gnl/TRDRNA2_/TRDRNA2_154614_c0_seq1:148-1083(+)